MVRLDSLRQKAYQTWVKNPYITAKKFCEDNKISYKIHGAYINKLLSEYRSYHQFVSPQEAHLPEHRVFEWECIPRSCELSVGWVEVVNRNGMWVFRDVRGTVHWYKEGLVRLYLRGELQLAKAKELFSRAFSWFTPEQLRKYLDVPLNETYKKWTFNVGAPMARFDIRQFERSHGLRIFTDGSHPTSLHVGEATPFWIDEWRRTNQEFGQVIGQFGVEIKEHLNLIQEWQKEAKTRMGAYALKRKRRIKKTQPPVQRNLLGWMLGGEAKT